jgi:hypothetical protein
VNKEWFVGYGVDTGAPTFSTREVRGDVLGRIHISAESTLDSRYRTVSVTSGIPPSSPPKAVS